MRLSTVRARGEDRNSGFTLIELLVVVAIIIVVSAVVLPGALTSMKNLRLQGAARDFSSLLQQGRMRAVKDNTYYGINTGTESSGGTTVAFVDLNASGSYAAGDPVAQITSRYINGAPAITVNPTSPPNATALNNLVVPSGSITLTSTLPVYFNSRGMPCTVAGTTCPSLNPNNSNLPTGYVTYLQSQETQNWMAVTVTPAGRIQVWNYDGTNWNKQNQ
jgi:type IV fimbrial biogenesis protein FimT